MTAILTALGLPGSLCLRMSVVSRGGSEPGVFNLECAPLFLHSGFLEKSLSVSPE